MNLINITYGKNLIDSVAILELEVYLPDGYKLPLHATTSTFSSSMEI